MENEEKSMEIIQMREQGITFTEIGDTLNITPQKASSIYQKNTNPNYRVGRNPKNSPSEKRNILHINPESHAKLVKLAKDKKITQKNLVEEHLFGGLLNGEYDYLLTSKTKKFKSVPVSSELYRRVMKYLENYEESGGAVLNKMLGEKTPIADVETRVVDGLTKRNKKLSQDNDLLKEKATTAKKEIENLNRKVQKLERENKRLVENEKSLKKQIQKNHKGMIQIQKIVEESIDRLG